jgi:NTE family protein
MREAAQSGRPRVGLALGAGGARGWAHLGVLRRLDELGVPIDCVAGTSAGALVGAVYLAGRLDLLEALSRRLDWRQMARLFFEVNFPRSGLLTGRNVARFLQEVVGVDMIEALDRPFAAVATDLLAHHERVFTQGGLIDAIRASISIPGVFTPARCGDRDLVDGALVNPLPVSVLRAMGAARIIAVDVNLRPGTGSETAPAPADAEPARTTSDLPKATDDLIQRFYQRLPQLSRRSAKMEALVQKWTHRRSGLTIFDVLTQSTRIFENQLTRSRLLTDPPDLLIQPAVGDIATLDFSRTAPAIAAGAQAVDEKLPAVRALLDALKPPGP